MENQAGQRSAFSFLAAFPSQLPDEERTAVLGKAQGHSSSRHSGVPSVSQVGGNHPHLWQRVTTRVASPCGSVHGPITSPALLLGGSRGEAVPLLCSLRQALTQGQMRRLKVNKTGAGTPLGKLQAQPHLKAGKCAGACVRVSVLDPGFLLCEMWRETNCLQGAGTTSGSHGKKLQCVRAQIAWLHAPSATGFLLLFTGLERDTLLG